MPIPLRYPVLMPDTPPDIVTEIGNDRRLMEELITGARFQQEYLILEQDRINEANKRIEYKRLQGEWELIGRFAPGVYWQMIEEYGYECWADADFMEDTLKRNPGLRLRINRPVRVWMGTARNRAPERTRDPFPDLVQGIEHPAVAPPRVPGGCPEGGA